MELRGQFASQQSVRPNARYGSSATELAKATSLFLSAMPPIATAPGPQVDLSPEADIRNAAPAFAERMIWNIGSGTPASVCLEVGRPDHLGPLLGVVGDEPAEIGGRAGKQRAAELEQPRLELRILERCVDLSVEPVDDPDRRCLRRTDAEQRSGLVARNEVAHGRDVRQPLPSPGARHRQ